MPRRKPDSYDLFAAQQLKALRLERNITQAQIATALNLSVTQIQKYENAQNRMSISTLCRVAKFFNTAPTHFLLNSTNHLLQTQ